MIAYLNRHRGQSTLEYVVLIIIIIAALLSIQVYIKRGVQGRLKSASDDIGDQFSPGNTNVIATEKVNSKEKQRFGMDELGAAHQGVQSSKLTEKETTNSTMKAVVVHNDQEYWGQ